MGDVVSIRPWKRVTLSSMTCEEAGIVEGGRVTADGVTFEVGQVGAGWFDARPVHPTSPVAEPEPPRETHPDLVHARNLWEAQHDMRGLRSLAISEKYGRSHLWEKTDAVQG